MSLSQTLFLTFALVLNISTSYSSDKLSIKDFNKIKDSHKSIQEKSIRKPGRAPASLNDGNNSYGHKAAKEISKIFQSSLIQSSGIKNK